MYLLGPRGKVVAIKVLDASELIPNLRETGIEIENLSLKFPSSSK
jgi:hypothetical protein